MTPPTAPHSATAAEMLVEAINHPIFGSQAALARYLGVAQPSVWRWVKRGKPLPGVHVLKVEDATGISRHDLRPDLYPRENTTLPTLPPISMIDEVAP